MSPEASDHTSAGKRQSPKEVLQGHWAEIQGPWGPQLPLLPWSQLIGTQLWPALGSLALVYE